MPSAELLREGQHVMTVCNACRYCEAYCAVFPAMENRLTFNGGDLNYLANLCHNCGECLYACQYAPPHQFAINVPWTLAKTRLASYEAYCWPAPLGAAFRRPGLAAALGLAVAASAVIVGLTLAFGSGVPTTALGGNFYGVISHEVMVAAFGAVFGFVVLALGIGVRRFWRHTATGQPTNGGAGAIGQAIRDALTLKYLHGDGPDCTTAEETRDAWRRWFHHVTFYGFICCFASTTIAAIYHVVFGWHAPYAYSSLPVVLGTIGGIGLLVGPIGLVVQKRRRDKDLADPKQNGLDLSFITLLLLSAGTGLVLLVLRERAAMGWLLVIHLGCVLALFLTLPYGKFVHSLYRVAALIKYSLEDSNVTHDAPG